MDAPLAGAAVKRAWLVGALVIASCDGQSASSGLHEPFRVRGAQFIEGPLPASNSAGPKITNVTLSSRIVLAGQAGKAIDGRVQSSASSIALRLGDIGTGYWVVVAGPSDSLFAGENDWHADSDYNSDFAASFSGFHPLRMVAIDANGTAGEQTETSVCFASKVPDNLHSCDPTLAPPDAVISLVWDQNVDLDLQVVTPDSTVVEPKHPSTGLDDAGTGPDPNGGVIDRDSLVACVPDGRRQEDLVWQKRPTGQTFDVYANLFDACGKQGVSFTMTVYEAQGEMPNRNLVAVAVVQGRLGAIDANGGAGTGQYLTSYSF